MKSVLTFSSVLAVFLVGGFCLVQRDRLRSSQEMTASLERQLGEKSADLDRSETARRHYEKQRNEMFAALTRLTAKIRAQGIETPTRAYAAATPAAPGSESKPLDENEALLGRFNAKLMDNSELEEFIRTKLWLALDELNNPLVKNLNLTPSETEKFKDLIVNNLIEAAKWSESFLDQGASVVEAEMEGALATERQNFDTQVHRLLGEARYAQYKGYRDDYSQFNRVKFLDGNRPLSDDQAQEVLAVMAAERQIVFAAAESQQNALSADEQAQRNYDIQKTINERVYEQLKGYLSADQLAAFADFQAQQLARLTQSQ
jgi:hypothetical protein